ncbi:hypothetical protein SCHIN_v1c08480 [Spiroplasma chinense]|uniref:Transmembrane protein n=1 Tax=Spiroplasma chinense TaxID=216932 RepID=A0A5B9Y5H0_9MOLU|nr:hypothetical protein [Spiroplasma chinense]QEH62043.1 hypothetical protein SCHIN_v1c08480 [Spiroplasma chinense]
MKKFSIFLLKLKPYKRKYKMFWMVFIICCMLIFQFLMLTLSMVVPHNRSGFYYWFNGLHALLGDSRTEPNAAQGFIFAATIVGFIPIIPIIPVLYFTFANWFIQEKLSDKYIDVPKEKYMKWSTFYHFSGIAVVFLLIPGLISYAGGGGILPQHTFGAIPGAFTNNFMQRVAGICAFLYYGVGCVFAVIIIGWSIWMALCWVGRQIQKGIDILKAKYAAWKETKRAEKLDRMEAKAQAKASRKSKKE